MIKVTLLIEFSYCHRYCCMRKVQLSAFTPISTIYTQWYPKLTMPQHSLHMSAPYPALNYALRSLVASGEIEMLLTLHVLHAIRHLQY